MKSIKCKTIDLTKSSAHSKSGPSQWAAMEDKGARPRTCKVELVTEDAGWLDRRLRWWC